MLKHLAPLAKKKLFAREKLSTHWSSVNLAFRFHEKLKRLALVLFFNNIPRQNIRSPQGYEYKDIVYE